MAKQGLEYEQYEPQQPNGRLFSSAMFGFNKDEVLDYLEEVAEENHQQQEASSQRIQELNQRLAELEMNVARQNADIAAAEQAGSPQVEELAQELDIAKAATQQAEEDLQDIREQLFTAQQENNWLREEFQKSDKQIADLRRQLDAASNGQWNEAQQKEIELLRHQLNAAAQAAQADSQAEIDSLRQQLENAMAMQPSEDSGRAAAIIIQEATIEADRIREEANAEKERVQRQLKSSAGNIVSSIGNLRNDLADIEGNVTEVLENMQVTLSGVMAALGRTEQNLAIFDAQVDRFPGPAPGVPTPQPIQYPANAQQPYAAEAPYGYNQGWQPGYVPAPQAAPYNYGPGYPAQPGGYPAPTGYPAPAPQPYGGYANPAPYPAQAPADPAASRRKPAAAKTRTADKRELSRNLSGGARSSKPEQETASGFRRVWPDEQDTRSSNVLPFRPTYTNSSTQSAYWPQVAEDLTPREEANEDERLHNLSEKLVDTLREMLT